MKHSAFYYRCMRRIKLARLGYRLATGRLSQNDAEDIILEVKPIAGWYPLETLSVENTIEMAGYRWSNPADEIRELAADACNTVACKWSSSGAAAHSAEDWACEMIKLYAARHGIELIEGEREDIAA